MKLTIVLSQFVAERNEVTSRTVTLDLTREQVAALTRSIHQDERISACLLDTDAHCPCSDSVKLTHPYMHEVRTGITHSAKGCYAMAQAAQDQHSYLDTTKHDDGRLALFGVGRILRECYPRTPEQATREFRELVDERNKQ